MLVVLSVSWRVSKILCFMIVCQRLPRPRSEVPLTAAVFAEVTLNFCPAILFLSIMDIGTAIKVPLFLTGSGLSSWLVDSVEEEEESSLPSSRAHDTAFILALLFASASKSDLRFLESSLVGRPRDLVVPVGTRLGSGKAGLGAVRVGCFFCVVGSDLRRGSSGGNSSGKS